MKSENTSKECNYKNANIAISIRGSGSGSGKPVYSTLVFEFYGDLFELARHLLTDWKNRSILDMYSEMSQYEKIYRNLYKYADYPLSDNIEELLDRYGNCNFIFIYFNNTWCVKERGKRIIQLRFMTQESFDSYADYQKYMFMKERGYNPMASSGDTLDKVISDETTHSATIAIVTNVIFGKYYGDIIRLESKEDVFGTTEFKNLLNNGIRHIDLTWHIHPTQLIEKAIINEYGDSVKFVSDKEDSFAVRNTDQIIELADSDYNYLYDEVDWFINYRGEDEYRPIFSDPVESDKSVDYVEEETTMIGIKTSPIYDREYFKVGDVVRVTPTEKLQYKVSGWQSRPKTPFNAIIIDVIPEKLMIVYYSPSTRKLCGRYAIPAEWVNDGFIKIEKIVGA